MRDRLCKNAVLVGVPEELLVDEMAVRGRDLGVRLVVGRVLVEVVELLLRVAVRVVLVGAAFGTVFLVVLTIILVKRIVIARV